jgi:DNA-binding NarL/FixJ family response regulator
MNGMEATKHIKNGQPATSVIGLSDNNFIQVRDLMIEPGADGFLPKEGARGQLYPLIAKSIQTRIVYHSSPRPRR